MRRDCKRPVDDLRATRVREKFLRERCYTCMVYEQMARLSNHLGELRKSDSREAQSEMSSPLPTATACEYLAEQADAIDKSEGSGELVIVEWIRVHGRWYLGRYHR